MSSTLFNTLRAELGAQAIVADGRIYFLDTVYDQYFTDIDGRPFSAPLGEDFEQAAFELAMNWCAYVVLCNQQFNNPGEA